MTNNYFKSPLLFKFFRADIVLQLTAFGVIAFIHSLEESSLSEQIEESETLSTVIIVMHVGKPFISFIQSFILDKDIEP